MSERDAFDRILATLHEAALDDTRWPAASALIDDALRTEGNSLVVGADQPGEGVRIFYAGFFYRGERNTAWERRYFDDYYPRDERIPRLRALPDSQLVHCRDLYTDEELTSSPAYNVALAVGQTQDSINVRLDGPGGSRIVWVVNDPVDAGGWSSRQIDMIRRLLPHIRQYVSVRQALAEAGALGSSFDALLAATGCGIVQLDARGRILAANDRARAFLRTGDGLLDQGGLLSARWPEDAAELQRLLARALPPFGAPGAAGSMMVRRPEARPPLKLHVVPTGQREAEFRAWPVAVLVFITHPRSLPRLNPDLVEAALGLTPAESRVAVLLAEGKTVGQIAAAVGREQSTIRTHVRHIFGKHGITRQVDLVRLVLSTAGASAARR